MSRDRRPSDQLLAWCSTRGSGNIDDIVAVACWLKPGLDRAGAYRLANELSYYGHIEIDWTARRWAVAPPRLVVPTACTGIGFMVGRRSADWAEDAESACSAMELDASVVTVADETRQGATVVFVRAGSPSAFEEVGALLDVDVTFDTAHQIGRLLPTLDRMPRKGRVPGGFESRRLELSGTAIKAIVDNGPDPHGAYEHDTFGPHLYSIRDRCEHPDETFVVDRPTAYWSVLRSEKLNPLRYDSDTRELTVPVEFRLPLLHERALIFASGLPPAMRQRPGRSELCYVNVSPALADQVHRTLL